jgi:hypothetical protein
VKIRIIPVAAGLAAAAGLAITGASLASAQNGTVPSAAAATSAAYADGEPDQAPLGNGAQGNGAPQGNGNTDPSKPMRADEQLLTGDVAAKVTAAAKAKEPTATIERVETDSEGVYEAHMVRGDGTHITVQVDKSYTVTAVQEGGPGGRSGRGGPGDSDEQGEGSTGSSTTTS